LYLIYEREHLINFPLDSIVKQMPPHAVKDLKPAVSPDALQILTRISRFLVDEGISAYLVGGFVRDMLLGRDTADIDIAVAADALATASRAADALGGRYVRLDEKDRVGRVVFTDNDRHIDLTTLQGDIGDDLARRDFTIDAMAFRLDAGIEASFDENGLIDTFHGRDDLRAKTVRAVRDAAFREDPVRLVRAMRIAGELGFDIDAATEELMRRDAALVAGAAGERVREELLRLLALPGAGRRLARLGEMGLLTALVPELAPTRGVEQPVVHVWDVYEHSVQTVAALEFVLREADWDHADPDLLAVVSWSDRLRHHFDREISHGSTRRTLLKLAALLHDIAKPQTKATDSEGRTRFLGHPQEGAAIAAAVLERLRFSNREIQLVELLIRYHLRPTQMSQEGVPTRRAIYRYFRDLGEAGIELLFLSLADHLATRGRTLDMEQWRQHAALAAYVLEKRFAAEIPTAPPRLIDGNDIITTFGLEPGPRIGELLEAVREARAAGEITERQQALDLVKDLLDNPASIARGRTPRGEE
jgi:poly(A) polymerase